MTAHNLEGWAKAIDVGMRNDGFEIEDYRRAVDYAHRDPDGWFWRPNIRSGGALRRQCDRLLAQTKTTKNDGAGMTSDGVSLFEIDYGSKL